MAFNLDRLKHFVDVFRSAYDRGGFQETWDVLMRGLYRRLRSRMEVRTYATYNGVSVNIDKKALDEFVPAKWLPKDQSDIPTYESSLCAGLRENVRPGDRIVIVGGGWGVTTVVAARATGRQGAVMTFEELSSSVEKMRWTVETARCTDTVRIVHSHVEGRLPDFTPTETRATRPEDLPECEVLELDCEGAELGILERMTIRPRLILVESHGVFGSSSKEIRDLLARMGYAVISEDIAEAHQPALCQKEDIMVLVATAIPNVESGRPDSPFMEG